MECNKTQELLEKYASADITGTEYKALESHIQNCPQCWAEFKEINGLVSLLQKSFNAVKATERFNKKVLQAIKTDVNPVNKQFPRHKNTVSRWRKFFSLSKEYWPWELATAACLLLFGGWLVFFGPATYEGYYVSESGSPYSIRPAGSDEWKIVSPAEKPQIKKGDTIKTTINQSTEIKLSDKATVNLFENTELTIKGKDKQLEVIHLKEGEIYVETQPRKSLKTKGGIKVETPTGEIINRGTKFGVSVTDNKQRKEKSMKGITTALTVLVTVMVIEGQVSFMNSYGEQVVNAGETATATPDSKPVLVAQESGFPSKPRTMTDEVTIKELIQQLGNDNWQKRESTQKELIQYGEKLIEGYRKAKRDKKTETTTKIKETIGTFARAIQNACWVEDAEIKYRANQIRQCLYSLTQPKIAFASGRDAYTEIYVMDADGKNPIRLTDNKAYDRSPVWSPDGTRIAFASKEIDAKHEGIKYYENIYIMDSDGKNQTSLTDNKASDRDPAWSPDGTKIAFMSDRDGNHEIYIMDSDGKNQTRLTLTDNKASDRDPAWSPTGTKIAFVSDRRFEALDELYVMDADGKNQTKLEENGISGRLPAWSPDGTKIAFVSSRKAENGLDQIYVMGIDGKNQTRLTKNKAENWDPAWSPDSKRIAFASREMNGKEEIYVMDADGKNPTRLTENKVEDSDPVWSPSSLAEISILFAEEKK